MKRILLVVLLGIFACDEAEKAVENLGTVNITLRLPNESTLHPLYLEGGTTYKLIFTHSLVDSVHVDEDLGINLTKSLKLPAGSCKIEAEGYFNNAKVLAGEGTCLILTNKTVELIIDLEDLELPNIDTDELVTTDKLNLTNRFAKPITGNNAANTEFNADNQYIGSVSWLYANKPFNGNFAPVAIYIAVVQVTAAHGYTFKGLNKNSFSYNGATSVEFNQDASETSGTVTVQYPVTDKALVDKLDLTPYFAKPETRQAANAISFTVDSQYTGTGTWQTTNGTVLTGNFAGNTVYVAHIALNALPDYTLAGLKPDSFIYTGANVVFNTNTSMALVTFPATAAPQTNTANISITYWYGDLQITSNNGSVIRKSGIPESIIFTAPDNFTNIQWYQGIRLIGSDKNLEIHAKDYEPGTYKVKFIAKMTEDNLWYSNDEPLIFTVTDSAITYTVTQIGGSRDSGTTIALKFVFSEPIEALDSSQIALNKGTGNATPGILKGAGTEWLLSLYELSAGTISVSVQKEGILSAVATIELFKHPAPTGYVWVPPGTFTMGETAWTDADELPHSVTLTKAYYLSDHETTIAEWLDIFGTKPWEIFGVNLGGDYPALNINWYHIIAYCNKLSIKEGLEPAYNIPSIDWTNLKFEDIPVNDTRPGYGYNETWEQVTWNQNANGYRLPTEAEWEYAARGGPVSQGYTYSGSNNVGEVAWYKGNSGSYDPHPVKQKKANELGLYDMSGNAFEYVWDRYAPFSRAAVTDPLGASTGTQHMIRGGSWNNSGDSTLLDKEGYFLRCAYRYWYNSTGRDLGIGFRLARNSN